MKRRAYTKTGKTPCSPKREAKQREPWAELNKRLPNLLASPISRVTGADMIARDRDR
jgi:hypothetical protein